jgi:5S rRNA maturation endonuclease (ribonuclease M5)
VADGWTLDDALNFGQGIERPFRCPDHDDTNASASVNVLKGVWVCYACQASGSVKDKKAPTAAQLAAMLRPEEVCRVYPETWLDLFRDHGHWGERFDGWIIWAMQMGEDPFTGDAVFPVRTAEGKLAGVGRRLADPGEDEPRYKYPARWSASRTLGGYDKADGSDPVGILVEGFADMTSLREIGTDTFSVFGSGVHAPQYELIHRMNKRVWLLGFDMDDAGERAAFGKKEKNLPGAFQMLKPDYTHVARIKWPKKDPAECSIVERQKAIMAALQTVASNVYGGDTWLRDRWDARIIKHKAAYTEWLKEVA